MEKSEIEIYVEGLPRPATRQVRRDRWKPSKAVEDYRAWKDRVVVYATKAFIEQDFKKPVPGRVAFSFQFGMPGYPNCDLDNLIKAIKDALVKGGFLKDDTIKHVRRYKDPVEAIFICEECPDRKQKRGGGFHETCGNVRNCKRSFAWFKIYLDD